MIDDSNIGNIDMLKDISIKIYLKVREKNYFKTLYTHRPQIIYHFQTNLI